MSRYLLDTDTLTLIQFGHAAAVSNVAAHADSEVALAAVTLQEQMRGWLAHLNKLSDPAQIADWYDRLEGVYREHWQHFLGWSDEGLLLHPTAREVAVFWDNGRWVGRRSKRRVYMKRRK